MKSSIVLLTGSVITMAESEFHRIKKAVKSAPSASVVTLNFVDEEGTEHILPFSSVCDLRLTAAEAESPVKPKRLQLATTVRSVLMLQLSNLRSILMLPRI